MPKPIKLPTPPIVPPAKQGLRKRGIAKRGGDKTIDDINALILERKNQREARGRIVKKYIQFEES